MSLPLIQVCQVLVVLVFAPLLSGFLARIEAMAQSRHGPSIVQPYYDLLKLFRKGTAVPETASIIFFLGPVLAFAAYATIPVLIPVLTIYPLPLATMADILGSAFLFGLGSFAIAMAAADSGDVYAGLGASRTTTFGSLAEPTLIMVFFTVALLTRTDLPYAMNAVLRGSAAQWVRPAHLLVVAAFFMMLLLETGRIPIESSSSTLEFGMIDEARLYEHSGPWWALAKWGSAMKQFLLFVVFLNVLTVPWWLAADRSPLSVLLATLTLLGKMLVLLLVIASIELSFAKLRLFKIPEFVGAGFVLSVLAVIVFYFVRG